MTNQKVLKFDNRTKYLDMWQYLYRLGITFSCDASTSTIMIPKDQSFDLVTLDDIERRFNH